MFEIPKCSDFVILGYPTVVLVVIGSVPKDTRREGQISLLPIGSFLHIFLIQKFRYLYVKLVNKDKNAPRGTCILIQRKELKKIPLRLVQHCGEHNKGPAY